MAAIISRSFTSSTATNKRLLLGGSSGKWFLCKFDDFVSRQYNSGSGSNGIEGSLAKWNYYFLAAQQQQQQQQHHQQQQLLFIKNHRLMSTNDSVPTNDVSNSSIDEEGKEKKEKKEVKTGVTHHYSLQEESVTSNNSRKRGSEKKNGFEDLQSMSNEELADTSTIPGWELIHTAPGRLPRGALVGHVVSTKMQKTVNVAVERYRLIPKIRKKVMYTRKFMAHDENEIANLGDLVMITPCHKISKMKHFMLREIVRPKGQL